MKLNQIPLCCAALLVIGSSCKADRILQAPLSSTVYPNSLQIQGLFSPSKHNNSLIWLQYGTPQGIEMEVQRSQQWPDPKARFGLNIAYPLLIDIGSIPSVSVGVRDLFGTGIDHMSVYAAVGRSVPLSAAQNKWLRSVHIGGGLGTGRLNGLFVSVRVNLRSGATLYAELYRYRPDFALILPLLRGLHAKVASINGALMLGAQWTLLRG